MNFILKILLSSVVFLTAFISAQSLQQERQTPLPKQTPEITESTPQNQIATTTKLTEEKVEIPVKEKLVITPQIEVKAPVTPIIIPQIPKTEVIEFDKINESTRNSLVNILCTTQNNTLHPLSGSGVLIDSKGVILTNAHIGLYFLLPEYIDCIIRTGAPAYPAYKAKPLYISADWIFNNAHKITESNPQGTGQFDYAILFITEKINGDLIQYPLPFLKLFPGNTTLNEYMLLASYPAEFLGGISISKNLYPASSIAQVKEIFTFTENSADLFSIGGTVLSQKGSSGGAVVNKDGLLSGLIVTETESEQTKDRDLRAISIKHIDQSIQKETGKTLSEILNEASAETQGEFQTSKAPLLKKALLNELTN